MKYKALMLDLDGTTIPNRKNGMPSQKVINAIKKASKKMHVGIATSRCISAVLPVITNLSLSGPSVLNGGAKVILFPTRKFVTKQPLDKKDANKTIEILTKLKVKIFICENDIDTEYKVGRILNETYMIYGVNLLPQKADAVAKALSVISTISIHKVPDWTHGRFSITISHVNATKQQGIFEVAKILGITTKDIIGVGDGHNDFPLLMACGFKVAMGNAVDDLKAIADYVAPTVEEDGVADVIEKFVLQ